MTKVIQRVELTLRSFYIFNATFCGKEGEESKKILYYHPQDIELNTKIKDVGLTEAIIKFAGNFNDDNSSCRSLHTQKTTQIFYQPERDYWMVMVLNVPKEVRSKDGVEVTDYKGGEVHDRIYRAALQQCYNMFRLFAGSFGMHLKGAAGTEQLQQRLAEFYGNYLLSLKLNACDVIDALRSIQYLPLDKTLFLRAHNFISMIQATFPSIVDTILLYNAQIVCSKISPTDLYCIHAHLLDTALSQSVSTSSSTGASLARSNSTAAEFYRNGGYVTGPENWPNSRAASQVYLMRDGALQTFYLVIYRALNATLCLLLNATEPPAADFYNELHAFTGPQLAHIASDVAETLKKPAASPASATNKLLASALSSATTAIDNDPLAPKYLFINEQSLKHMSNIYMDRCRPKANSIPANVMNLIADLNTNMQWDEADVNTDEQQPNGPNGDDDHEDNDTSAAEEVLVKTTNDFWIVKRRCNWRQFYVIIFNNKSTLLDVTQEARKIFELEITDDVFFDK